MKKVIIDTLKGYKWKIVLQFMISAVNIYLLTYPAKIVGKIIDHLYDIEANKQIILNDTYYLLGICIVLLFVRIAWKYLYK